MKSTRYILTLALLSGGVSFAGTSGKECVPAPVTPYIAVFGGGYFDDATWSSEGFADRDFNMDNGWIVGGAVGVKFANGIRAEVEVTHSDAPANTVEIGNLFSVPATGGIETNSLMFNAVKEFGKGRFHPYLGAGIGLSSVDVDMIAGPGIRYDGEEVVFAYHFLAGVGFDLTDRIQTFLEYRIGDHGNPSDIARNGAFGSDFGSMDVDWQQSVILGVRFSF
jgi:opacity protein-like surface antigen